MESANLNLPPDNDARLAALLRSTHTDLPDDGFTARVLAALPPPTPSAVPFLERPAGRPIVLSIAALAGLALALWQGLSVETLRTLVPAVQQTTATASVSVTDPAFSIALFVTAASVLYAMKPRFLRLL
jgi:hypothetical protein